MRFRPFILVQDYLSPTDSVRLSQLPVLKDKFLKVRGNTLLNKCFQFLKP